MVYRCLPIFLSVLMAFAILMAVPCDGGSVIEGGGIVAVGGMVATVDKVETVGRVAVPSAGRVGERFGCSKFWWWLWCGDTCSVRLKNHIS